MMVELTAARERQAILEHTQRLAESAVAAGPAAVVPSAQGWTTTDLVAHVGQTQHWVAEIIERRITDPTQLPKEFAEVPTDSEQWQAWLSESAQRVASACSEEALDAPVWNAAGDERTGTRFWMTSALNESPERFGFWYARMVSVDGYLSERRLFELELATLQVFILFCWVPSTWGHSARWRSRSSPLRCFASWAQSASCSLEALSLAALGVGRKASATSAPARKAMDLEVMVSSWGWMETP